MIQVMPTQNEDVILKVFQSDKQKRIFLMKIAKFHVNLQY